MGLRNFLKGEFKFMTEQEWRDEFGRNLSGLIYEANITQKDLAEMAGITESDVSRYVNGIQTPTAITIVNISYALGCEYDELIDFDERIDR